MSSSHLPADCALQPSWDEFNRPEELEYDTDSNNDMEPADSTARVVGPILPPGL